MMRVMLVNSPWVNEPDRYGVKAGARWAHVRERKKTLPYFPFPFAMAYATAVLKRAGYPTKMLDAVAMGWTVDQTLAAIREFKTDLVVLETSTPSIYDDLEFARKLADSIPVTIVYSGPHATALPEEVLASGPGLAVLRGEYDDTLLDLVRTLSEKNSLEHVRGISYREDDSIRHNPNRPLITDLDGLPYPERDDLPMPRYTDPSCKKFPNVSLLSSRGCPYRCSFCLESTVFYHSPSFRTRDPQKVVEEMIFVRDRYGAREIYFDDASFTASVKHARNIARAILDNNLRISWSCMADARVDFDTLKLMKEAGCIGLKFGVETADPELMERVHKHLELDHVREFVNNCRKLGLYTHGTFMFGLPGETKESIRRTLDYAFSLKCTTSQFSVATPFPGTEFFEQSRREGWLITQDWRRFDGASSPVIQYPTCSPEDIRKAIEEAKKRKILHLLTMPGVLIQYLVKLYRIRGLKGLFSDIFGKLAYLLERNRRM